MAATGLDAVLVHGVHPRAGAWSPERFVRGCWSTALRARVVVVGADIRFGHRNSGDVQTLGPGRAARVRGRGAGRPDAAAVGGPLVLDRRPEAVADGDVAGAAGALGRPHRVTGGVVHGDHRGRELGFPTANLARTPRGLVPADGVYAGWLVRPDLDETGARVLPAAVSVGTNPTFDGTQRRVEAYVLDRTDLDLYGESVGLEFVQRLRPTLRFDGSTELVVQMPGRQECRAVLGGVVPPDLRPDVAEDEFSAQGPDSLGIAVRTAADP